MVWLLVLWGCGGDGAPSDGVGEASDPTAETGLVSDTSPTDTGTTETGTTASPSGTTGVTGATGDTGEEPPPWDCAALTDAPPATRFTGPPASEDFAFDRLGNMISFDGTLIVASTFPPGSVTPIASTFGSGAGPASIRLLPTSEHLVYHDVDTSTLYDVDPTTGAVAPVFSGFGYAGGIEVRSDELVYVVDLLGLHLIDPTTGSHQLLMQQADWFNPNGVTLSVDGASLYVSSSNGVWAVPLDADGVPTAVPTLWAAEPPDALELLGMGVDACDNVYVVGTTLTGVSTLWRYPGAGGPPVVLLERQGAWYSNLQWGSGVGGWDEQVLYVVDRALSGGAYEAVEVGVGEKPR